jgi:hypothetical protein
MRSSSFDPVELPPLRVRKGKVALDPNALLSDSEQRALKAKLEDLLRKRRQSEARASTIRLS